MSEFDVEREARKACHMWHPASLPIDECSWCSAHLKRLQRCHDAAVRERDREWQRAFLVDGLTDKQVDFQVGADATIPAGPEWLRSCIDDHTTEMVDEAVRETEDGLILEGCCWCRDYGPPEYRPAGPVWMHPAGQTPIQGIVGGDVCIECKVPAIHERRRRRENPS